MAAVGTMLASAVVKEATTRLGAAIGGQIKLRWNFSRDLREMKDTLESIEAALQDAERRSFKDASVRLWLRRLMDAADDITTMLDVFEAKSTSNPRIPKLLAKIFRFRKLTKMSMAKKMKKMRHKLKNIADQRKNYAFKEESSPSQQQLPDKRETWVEVKSYIVGRTDEKEKLLSCLRHAVNQEMGFTVLPIYGIGGVGKTTLAKMVFSDAMFKDYSAVWVYVSQMFDLKKIGNYMISELSKSESNLQSMQMVQNQLVEVLANKRVLIVLDDVWESSPEDLDKLKDMLNVGRGSNVIAIVTTRCKDIANKICTVKPYKIPLLSNDMCWAIIKLKANFEARSDKDELETMGRDIASKCGGLALAAQTLGYMLESRTFHEWESVRDDNIWDKSTSGDISSSSVIASLMLSYNSMSPYLKLCFAYCATFPKGHKIVKDDLIYQWISLGFIEPPNIFSTWQHGEKYVSHLIGMSFLQCSKSDMTFGVHHEDVTMFTMHDLVHDLARSVMVDEILDASKQDNNTGGSRTRFALLNHCTKPLKSFTQCPTKVRSLRFIESENTVLHGASSSSAKYLRFLVCGKTGFHDDIFSAAKYLHVLELSECSIQKLPNSIGNLKLLRYLNAPRVKHQAIPSCITKLTKLIYLSLRGSDILALPESIGELKGLMYLDLSYCRRLEKLPVSFGMLTKLVHLDLSCCYDVTGVPESLESLTNLEYLNLSKARYKSIELSLPECFSRLTNLKYLNLRHSLYFLEDHDIIQAIGSLTKLQYLNLSECSLFVRADSPLSGMSEAMRNLTELCYLNLSECSTGAEELSIFLKCISNLPNLEHLDLSITKLTRVPDCICSLRKLHTLDLSYCFRMKSLPAILNEMDSLKFVHLKGCNQLEPLEEAGLNKKLITLPRFLVQADYHHSSSNLALLHDVNRTDLVISRLENVKSVQEARSVRLMEKGRMKEMKLNWTTDSERFVEDMEVLGELVPPITLEKLYIDGYSSVRFPQWFTGIADHLPNLGRISLSNLPNCNALPPLGQLPNLKELKFSRMSGLSKIDGDLCGTRRPSFPRLEEFYLHGMESLEVWYTTYSHGGDCVSKFMFPNLRDLEIHDCPNLRLKPCLHRAEKRWKISGRCDGVISSWEETASQTTISSPSSAPVTTLDVSDCKVPMHQWRLLHHLPALSELNIYKCSDLSSSPEITQALSSLQTLTLMKSDQLEAEVPNWLGHIASLKELSITGRYEMQASQGSVGHLTCLQSLDLSHIESMTTLPQWVADLISLQQLEISNCSNLNDLPETIGRLASLQILKIFFCENLNDLPESIGHLTSLTELRIHYCNGITSLPESIGGLTSLNKLDIYGCIGITSLPERIGALTSLHELDLRQCHGITSLPKSIQQLTKLKWLIISCSDELAKWCETEGNKRLLAHIEVIKSRR